MSSRLGEILVKESLITADQLKQALEYQKKNGGRLGTCLMKLGFISDDEITDVLSRQYGVPSINLKYYEVDPSVIKLIPQDTAVRYQIVPLSRVGSTLTIAMTDPDQRLRHGRYQVHDRLQRGAGGGVGDGDHRSDLEVLRRRGERRRTQQGDEGPRRRRRRDLELAAEEQEMDLAALERRPRKRRSSSW